MPIQSANISFGSGGGAQPVSPLPLRMLVVADFLGRRLPLDAPVEIQPIRIDQQNFNEVLARISPRLVLDVPNMLGGPGQTLEVSCTIGSIDDFRPEALVSAEPTLASLGALRAKILHLSAEGHSADHIRERIQPDTGHLPMGEQVLALLAESAGATESAEPAGDSLLDEITEKTTGQGSEDPSASTMDAVFASIGGSKHKGPPPAGVARAVAWMDGRIGAQLDAILHDPAFADLERAWRGLRMMLERADLRSGAIVQIAPSAKEDLRKVLVQTLLDQEHRQPGDPPLSVVVLAYTFDRSARDIDLLQEVAQAAENLQAPVIAEADPAFLGLEGLGSLGTRASLSGLLQTPEMAKWTGLRQSEPARWLAVCINRLLLRAPWGSEDPTSRNLAYRETVDEKTGQNLLWGPALWGLAVCILNSFARTGWPIFCSGLRDGGLVETLPLRYWEARPGAGARICLETGLSDAQAQELAMTGLIPLQCAGNRDKAFFSYVPSAHAPRRYTDPGASQDAALKALLPYQLYAGRVAAWLMRLLGEGGGGQSPEQLADHLTERIGTLLTGGQGAPPEDAVRVTVEDSPDHPTRYRVGFEIYPPFKLFNLTPRLELGAEMNK